MEILVTGHTTPSCFLPVRSSRQLGGVTRCRRDEAPHEFAPQAGASIHRALRAGCLTGCRAETPVSPRSVPRWFCSRNTLLASCHSTESEVHLI